MWNTEVQSNNKWKCDMCWTKIYIIRSLGVFLKWAAWNVCDFYHWRTLQKGDLFQYHTVTETQTDRKESRASQRTEKHAPAHCITHTTFRQWLCWQEATNDISNRKMFLSGSGVWSNFHSFWLEVMNLFFNLPFLFPVMYWKWHVTCFFAWLKDFIL